MRKSGIKVAFAAVLLAVALSANANKLSLEKVGDIPLTGNTSRFDYASIDPRIHELFVAHLGDSTVTVVDMESRKVVADIAGVGHVHGVLAVPELGRVYASATKTNEIVVIDARTLKVIARIPGGFYPDGMAYAPDAHKLYVSDEDGSTETVIDARTNQRIASIHLRSIVGNSQYDRVSGHIFVNAQTLDKLIEIDPRTDKVVGRYALPGGDGPHGLLIDANDRLAFVACQDNNKLLVLDMKKMMHVLASFNIGKDPDVLAFDPGLHRLYVAGEQGVVSVFDVTGDEVRKVGEGFIDDNAHVVTVDTKTHLVYFPLRNVGGFPVLRVMRPVSGEQ
jgi:YVTN family beta-propeller protein